MTGEEYGVLLGAESDYRFQVFNSFCDEIGPLAFVEGIQFEENGKTYVLEDLHPKKTERSNTVQLKKALKRIAAEHRNLCLVAELKGLLNNHQVEASCISYRSLMAWKEPLIYSGAYYSKKDAARAAIEIMSRNSI